MQRTHHAKKRGLAPGTLTFTGERKQEQARISSFTYSADSTNESELKNLTELKKTRSKLWLNIDGLHDTELIRTVGERFSIHPLALEDIVSTDQRPKVDDYESSIYIVVRMLTWKDKRVESEQVSFVLTKNALITFQEHSGDVFEPVRKRLRERKTRIAARGVDYLAYALIDAIIDNYFLAMEAISEETEALEEQVLTDPEPDTIARIQLLKRELVRFRRAVWPLREAISSLSRDQNELIEEETHMYLRDAYDHTVHVIDTVETLRDTVSGLLDIYLSNLSHKMNEVMKVLTIIATIFIPLTFIAGIYGMNFEVMPELSWRYGYFVVWGVMIAIGIGLIMFFRRRGWL